MDSKGRRQSRRGWARVVLAPVVAVAAFAAGLGVSLMLAPPASADTTVTVDFTQIGIYPRSEPSMSASKIGPALVDGDSVTVACEAEGEAVSNGYETIAIWDRLSDGTWLPNAFLATGTTSWTPGVERCEDYDDTGDPGPAGTSGFADPCMSMWPGGNTSTSDIIGGSRTDYDSEMSQYLVCEGFGADTEVEYSDGMKCAVIAAAATYSGVPGVGSTAATACDLGSISQDGLDAIPGIVCGILGEGFATGVGVAAAGVTSPSGPGAVAVGVGTYRALASAAQLSCGALFDGGAYDFGTQLEADHEAAVASDVVALGKCLRFEQRLGFSSWYAVDC